MGNLRWRLDDLERQAQRQAEADAWPTELIVRLGDTGEVERYDLCRPGWVRLDVDNEQEEASNGQLGQKD